MVERSTGRLTTSGTLPTRQAQTDLRRREILDAALAAYNAVGESGTFIHEVCTRSDVSVGTLYHHFRSKGQLLATLWYTILIDYQGSAVPLLVTDPPARTGIYGLIHAHSRWLMDHPDRTAYVLQHRFVGSQDEKVAPGLREQHQEYSRLAQAWRVRRMADGSLRQMPGTILVSLWLGPIHEWARIELLDHGLDADPGIVARRHAMIADLADGIWRSVAPGGPPDTIDLREHGT